MARVEAHTFSDFLARSLEEVRLDVPQAWRALLLALRGHVVLLSVDDELVSLRVAGDDISLGRGPEALRAGAPSVAVRTRREAILRMIDGEDSIERAVETGRFDLVGRLDDLIAFDGALRAYLRGAVRSPAHPSLLRAWRASPEPNASLTEEPQS